MRAFTAAALQVAPRAEALSRETIAANVSSAVDWVQRCAAASDAELIVLPETVTTGFSPGCSAEEPGDLATPDQTVEPFRRVRAKSAFTWSGGRTPRDRSAVSSTMRR